MKTVKLEKMVCQNFKGFDRFSHEFSENTKITGGNAKKKSTIYQAYLWCIFGKDANGNVANVQPRDIETKEVIHNLVTSVELYLKVNDTFVTIKRELTEEWSVNDNGLPFLKGTATKRFFNSSEVSCGVAEFKIKLEEICQLDSWLMMSNINTFFSLNTQLRRQTLQKLAGDVSDIEIAKEFPNVKEALLQNKTVDELKREISAKTKKANASLDEIPSRIDQQEKLRVSGVDFDEIRTQIKEKEASVQIIDNSLQKKTDSTNFEIQAQKRKEYSDNQNSILEIEKNIKKEQSDNKFKIEQSIKDNKEKIKVDEKSISDIENDLAFSEKTKSTLEDKIADLKVSWHEKNRETYNSDNICTECGQSYPEEKIEYFKSSFLKLQLEKKEEIKNEAENIQEKINKLISSINKLNLSKFDKETLIKERKEIIGKKQKELEDLPSLETLLSENKELKNLNDKCKSLLEEINDLNPKEDENQKSLKEKKEALQNELKALQEKLAQEKTNSNIDELKKELNIKRKELAQALSHLKQIELEIKSFQKRRIEIIEENVSSLFSIVKWKMYESNLTNDDEKAICEAYVNGVPYDETNEGMTMAIGVDVIQGLSKAFKISVPLFVDRFESVEILPKVNTQLITLEVVKGAELSINI